jgi:hypothetical protein
MSAGKSSKVVALAVLRGGDVHARAECDIYSRRHTRMFDILDEMGFVEELEDVELKYTRLMSRPGEHCGPQHNG